MELEHDELWQSFPSSNLVVTHRQTVKHRDKHDEAINLFLLLSVPTFQKQARTFARRGSV
jgi:hypothetical protein